MSYLADNLRFLRKKVGLTQSDLADKLGVNRSVIGAYEEGRAEPKVKTLVAMSHYFKVAIDGLLTKNLSIRTSTSSHNDMDLKVLPITVDRDSGNELVPLVPVKAAAGYADGYGDIDFIESLPQFELPFSEMKGDRTYRIFQIDGDSMLPIPSGAYILAEYLEDWSNMRDYQCHIVLTKDDGVVYKRTVNHLKEKGSVEMISDNTDYSPYTLEASSIVEVWKALGYVSFDLPDGRGSSQAQIGELTRMVTDLKREVDHIKVSTRNM